MGGAGLLGLATGRVRWASKTVAVRGLGIWLGVFLGAGAAPTFGLGEHLGFGEHLGLRGGRGFRPGDLAWGVPGGRGSPNLRLGGTLGVWGTLGVAGWSWFPVWGSGLGCSWGPGQPQPSVWGSTWGLGNTWGWGGGRGFRSGDLAWGVPGDRGSPNLRFGGALGVAGEGPGRWPGEWPPVLSVASEPPERPVALVLLHNWTDTDR